MLDRRLMRTLHGQACEGGRCGHFCLFHLLGLRVAYCETFEGIEIHIDNEVVVTAQVCARGECLQMPDLLKRRDRHLSVTPGILIKSVLRAGASLQRHLAAAGQPCKHFLLHGARQTGRHVLDLGATDTHSSTREQWWHECAGDGGVWGENLA